MIEIQLRQRTPVSYAERDGSDTTPLSSVSPGDSEFIPDAVRDDQEEETARETYLVPDDTESMNLMSCNPTDAAKVDRVLRTRFGRVLHPRQSLDFTFTSRKRASRTKHKNPLSGITLSTTTRNKIRAAIKSETRVDENNFLMHNKDFFLPLLPESNYITKLIENQQSWGLSGEEIPFEELNDQPAGITATLKPHQLTGLSFLVHLFKNGTSGLLGDEMGLGKTLQTLSLFQHLEEQFGDDADKSSEIRPYLVVCPLSVLGSWITEAKKWTPTLNVLQLHGSIAERNKLKKVVTSHNDLSNGDPFKLVVTTYETFVSERHWFKTAFVWRHVVLDEGHMIKNDTANISAALQGLKAEHRLILTGTPLQNNMVEMWALLHWLYPNVFTNKTVDLFKTSFDLTKGLVRTDVMGSARRLLELICLRRMKDSPSVNLGLPPKEEVLLYVPLTPMQRFWYTRYLTKAGNGMLEGLFRDLQTEKRVALKAEAVVPSLAVQNTTSQSESLQQQNQWEETTKILQDSLELERSELQNKDLWKRLMNLVMQLRKLCNHPYMMPMAQPEPYFLGEHVVLASGKFIVLKKLLEELVLQQRRKVLIFSGFASTLDLAEDLLALIGGNGTSFKYGRFDGGTSRARRNLAIRLFNSTEDYKVMLISTRAGGLGINLATATEVIFLDEDWNPQVTLQAEARAHRIGQKNPVTVYKLCTQGTVEEQMMGRIRKKLYLSKKITESLKSIHESPKKIQNGKGCGSTEDMPQLDTGTLKSLIRRGAQTLSHSTINAADMLSWDLQTILEKCRDKPSDPSFTDSAGNVTDHDADEQEWLATMEKVKTAVFEGRQVVRDTKVKQPILADEITRQDRRKGKNTTVMVDGFAVAKESMACGEWEAVPTLAGKDPRLAERKRKKRPAPNNQNHCQICWDGGNLHLCARCPRAYHLECMSEEFQSKTSGTTFICPQHSCFECHKNATNAGGLIYRCRWCHRGFCEDCLDFAKTELLGDALIEYEMLEFAPEDTAFYIKCHPCMDYHLSDQDVALFFEEQKHVFETNYTKAVEKRNNEVENTSGERGSRIPTPTTQDRNIVFQPGMEDNRQLRTAEDLPQTPRTKPLIVIDLCDDSDEIIDLVSRSPSKIGDDGNCETFEMEIPGFPTASTLTISSEMATPLPHTLNSPSFPLTTRKRKREIDTGHI